MNLRRGGRDADIGRMVQPIHQHVAPCVKGVEWGIGQEKFENYGSVLVRHPGLYNLDCKTRLHRPRRRCVVIGTCILPPSPPPQGKVV